jgi:protein-disulfide isomerase
MRILLLSLWFAVNCLAQDWQTAVELPGVDLSGLSPTVKSAVLKMAREQDCNCGCNLKIAECRVKDPNCSYSRALASSVAREFREGKNTDQAYATLRELQKQGPVKPRLLEDPVAISVKGDPSYGPQSAKITIVEFSDFQCPYCAVAGPKALAVAAQYPKDVKLVFKQFPLDSHSNAYVAAEASLAAHAQGKFWPLHDKMFANFRQLSQENILRWAQELGLDMTKFKADLSAGKHRSIIDGSVKEGAGSGVMGTPTFFINGKRYNGPFELQALKPVLDAELNGGAPR